MEILPVRFGRRFLFQTSFCRTERRVRADSFSADSFESSVKNQRRISGRDHYVLNKKKKQKTLLAAADKRWGLRRGRQLHEETIGPTGSCRRGCGRAVDRSAAQAAMDLPAAALPPASPSHLNVIDHLSPACFYVLTAAAACERRPDGGYAIGSAASYRCCWTNPGSVCCQFFGGC